MYGFIQAEISKFAQPACKDVLRLFHVIKLFLSVGTNVVNVSNSALGLLYGHGILTIYENLLL